MRRTPRTDALMSKLADEVARNNGRRVPMQEPLEQAIDHAADLERESDSRLEYAENKQEELREMEARKDEAYTERNKVVAALAWMAIWAGWKAGLARTAIEGWSDDWHGCVYIDLPSGQASWHYHDSHAPLFAGLPPYSGSWDGHTTPEKYERLAHIGEVLAESNEARALHQMRKAEPGDFTYTAPDAVACKGPCGSVDCWRNGCRVERAKGNVMRTGEEPKR